MELSVLSLKNASLLKILKVYHSIQALSCTGQFFNTAWSLVAFSFWYTLNHVCCHHFHLVQYYRFQEKSNFAKNMDFLFLHFSENLCPFFLQFTLLRLNEAQLDLYILSVKLTAQTGDCTWKTPSAHYVSEIGDFMQSLPLL